MKKITAFAVGSVLAVFLANGANAAIQASYSGPVTGWVQVALSAAYGNSDGGTFLSSFGTIDDTFNYDPVAQTLQEIGTVSVSPSTGSFNINGPEWDPGSGSATLTVGQSGSFAFAMTYQYDGNFYDGYDFSSTLTIPVSGTGIWDGEAFSSGWNLQIPIDLQVISSTPTSLTFSEEAGNGAGMGSGVVPGTDLGDGIDDGTYGYRWAVSGVATSVPEPDTLSDGLMLLVPLGLRLIRANGTREIRPGKFVKRSLVNSLAAT